MNGGKRIKCLVQYQVGLVLSSPPLLFDLFLPGCESFTEEKAHPYFYKHLTGVDLICPNLLCEAIIRYEQYSRHVERECDYSNQICCYTDCGE